MKQKSVLISCEPYLIDNEHQIRDDFFVFIVTFENGITGYKKSTRSADPYLIGVEYEFSVENLGSHTVISNMVLPNKIQLSFEYMQMLSNSIAYAVHTRENPTLEQIDEINRNFLKLKDDYVRSSSE